LRRLTCMYQKSLSLSRVLVWAAGGWAV